MKKPDKIIQMNSNIAAKAERSQYEQDRETIKRGMASFVETGTALARVRDSRSFELGGYDSFEKFCNAEFGFSPQYGNKLIDAASVVKALPAKISETIVSEGQARALAKAPEKERAAIIREVAKEGLVTARAIAEKIEERIPVEADYVEVDKTGATIPKRLQAEWDRRAEVAKQIIVPLRAILQRLQDGVNKDAAFSEMNNSDTATAKSLLNQADRLEPFAVCVHCTKGSGDRKGDCKVCHSTGIHSKFHSQMNKKK